VFSTKIIGNEISQTQRILFCRVEEGAVLSFFACLGEKNRVLINFNRENFKKKEKEKKT